MDSTKKECFFEAVKYLNFSDAAEKMYMTQPNFSKQIKALEEEVGFQLFIRNKKKSVRLTPLGAMYYKELVRLDKAYNELIEKLHRYQRGVEGHLNIGILSEHLPDKTFMEFISEFRENHPNVNLNLKSCSFSELLTGLDKGELDISIILEAEIPERDDLVYESLYQESSGLVVAKTKPYDETKEYSILDFKDEIFLNSNETAGSWEWIDAIFKRAGLENVKKRIVKNFNTVILLTEVGEGVVPCGVNHTMFYDPYLKYIKIKEFEPVWMAALWKKDNYNPMISEFYTSYLD